MNMVFIDYDDYTLDYHMLDLTLPDSNFVYDFEGLGLEPIFD